MGLWDFLRQRFSAADEDDYEVDEDGYDAGKAASYDDDDWFGSTSLSAAQWYDWIGLDAYDFSDEDKQAILDGFDYLRTVWGDSTQIEPISQSNAETVAWLRDINDAIGGQSADVVLVWYDCGSNYAGVYFQGEHKGKVILLLHDDEDWAPRYKSVSSFVQALKTQDPWDFTDLFYSATDLPPTEDPVD